MRLSLLDRSRTRVGEPEGQALHRTLDRARWAEELGLHRFWVAEHHGVPGIASGSPAVLLGAVGAATSTIRIGSGGVMLPHHQPFVVAEQFRMLAALYPGRVDLGLGRSSAFTEPVRRVLREDPTAHDRFAADVDEVRELLRGEGPVTVRPDGPDVPLFVLATGSGLEVAARLGLPVVVGGPILGHPSLQESLAVYRRGFRSPDGARPHVIVSADVIVADDTATARELALPEAWAMATARRTGEFPPLDDPASIRRRPWPEQVRRRVEASLDSTIAGPAPVVRDRLEALAAAMGADELLASTSTWDTDALRTADTALRDVLA